MPVLKRYPREEVDAALETVRPWAWTEDSAAVLASEVVALRATIARIEALPQEWREYAAALHRNHDNAIISRTRNGCADELDYELKDES